MANTTVEPTFSIGVVKTSRQFRQLGVLVEDGSGSMAGGAPGNMTKAQAVSLATRELLTRFKVSRYANNFDFAVVTYDHAAAVHTHPTPAVSIDDNASYDPMAAHGGGTNIAAGLQKARELVEAFLAQAPAEGVPHSAVIVVMSDGECQNPDGTRQEAQLIKSGPNGSRVTVCSTLFATVGAPNGQAEALLKEIASDPVQNYKTVYDANTLRGFFIASMSSASGTVIA